MQAKHTPVPWAVHTTFPTYVVPLGHEQKGIGGSDNPEDEARDFAKTIAREEGTEFPQFYRSRLLPEEARANAKFIVRACNSHADLLAALKAARTRLAHKLECGISLPASEWEKKGSWDFSGCNCEISIVDAAIARAEEV